MDERVESLPEVDELVRFGKDTTEHDAKLDTLMQTLHADKTEIRNACTEIPFFGHLAIY